MQTFIEYLQEKGIDPFRSSNAEKEPYRKEYRKMYQKVKNEQYRIKFKRIELKLNREEYSVLKDSSKRHKQKISVFIKKAAIAYTQKLFIVPDKSGIENLEKQLIRIGNNINNLAKFCHSTTSLSIDNIHDLQDYLLEINNRVSDIFKKPQKIEDFLEMLHHQNSNNIRRIYEEILKYLEHDNKKHEP